MKFMIVLDECILHGDGDMIVKYIENKEPTLHNFDELLDTIDSDVRWGTWQTPHCTHYISDLDDLEQLYAKFI